MQTHDVESRTVELKMSISSEITSSRSATELTMSDPVPSGARPRPR